MNQLLSLFLALKDLLLEGVGLGEANLGLVAGDLLVDGADGLELVLDLLSVEGVDGIPRMWAAASHFVTSWGYDPSSSCAIPAARSNSARIAPTTALIDAMPVPPYPSPPG